MIFALHALSYVKAGAPRPARDGAAGGDLQGADFDLAQSRTHFWRYVEFGAWSSMQIGE